MAHRTLQLDDALYDYVLAHSLREHPAQVALREATKDHPHAGMQIGPEQGQFMALLARILGARRAIEIGVFTGYSALTVALALPDDGYLLACDVSDEYTRIGKPYWQAAGVNHRIDLRIGPALQTHDSPPAKPGATTSPSSTRTRPAMTPITSDASSWSGKAASSRSTTCCGAA